MPAEWEPHEATWLSWPKDPETFPPGILENVERTFAHMIGALKHDEKVNVLVNDAAWEKKAASKLADNGIDLKNIFFHHIKSVDVWTRDYAPIFVKDDNGKITAVKWTFNAWGDKYEELKKDDYAGEQIAKSLNLPLAKPGIVLEGGSIDVNGKGILLTSEQCLLNTNRNPHLGKKQIEGYLKDYLGAERVIWLGKGVEGDDTDGHVDDIARFVNKDTVVCASEENENDENYTALKDNLTILEDAGLKVIPLPMPGRIEFEGRRLPASYANFYIANKVVLVPVFGHENDEKALEILRKCFPERNVISIRCESLVYGFGAIHCSTMQQPAQK